MSGSGYTACTRSVSRKTKRVMPSTTYRTGLKFDNIVGAWLGYYLKDSSNYLTAEADLNLAKNVEYKLKAELNTRWGKAGFQSIQTAPDLMVQRYLSNHFEWRNNFDPTKVQTIYASLSLKTKKVDFVPESRSIRSTITFTMIQCRCAPPAQFRLPVAACWV
jgi:hypothetical protein